MDEGIARANIKHFKTLLVNETDPAKRKILLEISAEQEQKLEAALNQKRKLGRSVAP